MSLPESLRLAEDWRFSNAAATREASNSESDESDESDDRDGFALGGIALRDVDAADFPIAYRPPSSSSSSEPPFRFFEPFFFFHVACAVTCFFESAEEEEDDDASLEDG